MLSAFHLQAYDLPIEVNCTNNVCDCKRIAENKFDIEEIVSFIDNGNIQDSIRIACAYHQIAIQYYHKFYDVESAIKYNKKAEEIRLKKNDGLLWRTNLNAGIYHFNSSKYNKASTYFEKALKINGFKEAADSVEIYSYLADCYEENGDIDKAISFAKKSITFNATQARTNSAKNTLAAILINTKDSVNLTSAIKYSNEVFESSEPIADDEKIRTINNLALANKFLGNYDKAKSYYQQAFEAADKTSNENKATLFNNIAALSKRQKKYKTAIDQLNESLSYYKAYFKSNYHYDYAANYENLGDNYMALHQLDSALFYYQKALINFTNNFRNEDIFANPNTQTKDLFIYSNLDLINVLHLKATALFKYYKLNKDKKYLTFANETYQTAFDFHDKLQKDISTEDSRLFHAKNIVPYIENALQIVYEQQENGQDISETTFRFMEKNKATVLLQSINESDALHFADLPDSLVQREKDLKITLNDYKRQLNDAVYYEDSTLIKQLEKNLFDANLSYQNLIDKLEKNHSAYYLLKHQPKQVQFSELQNNLTNETALLEYFVGDSSIYVFLIQKKQSKLFKIKKPDNWKNTINSFRDAVSLKDESAKANPYTKKLYRQFSQSAYHLFELLLKEPMAEMASTIHHLKIIPDAELNYLPFDILLTKKPDSSTVNYRTLPYLLKEKSIAYNYSAALLLEQMQTTKHQQDFSYGGYAARYLKTDSIKVDLPEIRQLVAETADFFSGKAYLNEAATKANFLKDTFNYNILHFAMHGMLNDQYPLNSHLVFTQNARANDEFKLFAADLYNLKLNTNLAVLSACETGTGELQKGEGVMSLSRAFTYAGCSSLVMSLWSIPEKSSVEVLHNFFKNLKKERPKKISQKTPKTPKDEALREAKLAYLENTLATTSHPVYWAGLVLTGNTEAMHFESTLNKRWWFLPLLIILFVGLYALKRYHIK